MVLASDLGEAAAQGHLLYLRNFRKDNLSGLLLGIVDRIDDVMSIHSLIINKTK